MNNTTYNPNVLDDQGWDTRAFLKGQSSLWVTQSPNPKIPLMQGVLTLPVPLLDFVREHSMHSKYRNAHALSLRVSLWEADPNRYHSEGHPQYAGNIYLNTTKLMSPYDKAYKEMLKFRGVKW